MHYLISSLQQPNEAGRVTVTSYLQIRLLRPRSEGYRAGKVAEPESEPRVDALNPTRQPSPSPEYSEQGLTKQNKTGCPITFEFRIHNE